MGSKLETCAECKRKCLLSHLKTRSSTPLVSSFFKVMITDRFSEVLLLPPKFAPVVSNLIGEEVPLEDSSGLQWKVKLSVIEKYFALNEGWDIFAQAHGLELGDFLAFHYVLGSHFVVQIFDKSGCEKLDFSKNKNQKKRTKADRNSTQGCGPSHVVDKGSIDKQESNSSVLFKPNMETSHRQCETSDVNNAKRARNSSSNDKKGAVRSQAVRTAETVEDPCFLVNRQSKYKINDPVNVKMAMNGSSSDRKRVTRSQVVPKAETFEDPCFFINGESKCKTNDSVNVKMAMNGSSSDRTRVARSRPVPKVEIFEDPDPCFFLNSQSNCKQIDPLNVKIPSDSGSHNKNRLPGPQSVSKARVFDREVDGKDAENRSANQNTLKTNNLHNLGSNKTIGAKDSPLNVDTFCFTKNQAGSDYKISHKAAPVVASKFGSSAFGRCETDQGREKANSINTGKKPKVKMEQEDPILSSPIGCRDKFDRKVKVEVINVDSSPSAGSITCLIEANQSFLELPAALPSSYKRGNMGSSKTVVFLNGPKTKTCPVMYHETPQAKVLKDGWEAFCRQNNIVPGDECTFEADNAAEDIFRVTAVTIL